jgi:hypothetical protein
MTDSTTPEFRAFYAGVLTSEANARQQRAPWFAAMLRQWAERSHPAQGDLFQ